MQKAECGSRVSIIQIEEDLFLNEYALLSSRNSSAALLPGKQVLSPRGNQACTVLFSIAIL